MHTDSLTTWLDAAGKFPLLTKSELIQQTRTIQQWKNGEVSDRIGQKALKRVINGNLRLVARVWRSQFSWVESNDHRVVDLLQEGVIGLRTAALKFEPSKGYQFSTYAVNWIRKEMGQYLRDRARTVRVSNDCFQVVRAAEKFTNTMLAEQGRKPTIAEIAVKVNKSIETTAFYLEQYNVTRMGSLNAIMGDSDEGQLQDIVPAQSKYSMEEDAKGEQLLKILQIVFDVADFSDEERQIITMRNLVGDGVPFSEIGEKLGLAASSVRPRYYRLMERLEKAAQASGFSFPYTLCQA